MSITLRYLFVFLVITLLTIIPLPALANQLRPNFILMLWIYLRIFNSERFNLFLLFLNGLMLDCLLYTVIGMHAFALTLVLWCITLRARRYVFFNLVQQSLLVLVLSTLYSYILLFINIALGNYTNAFSPLLIGLTSALLWPWLKFTLDDMLQDPIANKA